MTTLELDEHGPAVVVELDSDAGELLRSSGLVDAERLTGGWWQVAAQSNVGVARVGDVVLRIRPKVSIDRILFLLGYAKDPGWRSDEVTMDERADLLPALAEAFAGLAERAVEQGLLQGYVEVEDALTVVRGRLREGDQLRQRFGVALPVLVRYDDHSVDIAENRLLRGAVDVLLGLPEVAPPVRMRLRGLRLLLADVSPVSRALPHPKWRPTRLNARYHVALRLAELIIDANAVDHPSGDVRISGFIVNMNKVFEDFVTAALSASLARIGGHCRAQDSHYLDDGMRVRMKPDLVWYRAGEPAAVIDAKYKAEKPTGYPDADLYQLLAYCTALGLTDGHLIYAKGNEVAVTHVVRNAGVTIHAHALDLAQAPGSLLGQVESLATAVAGAAIGSDQVVQPTGPLNIVRRHRP